MAIVREGSLHGTQKARWLPAEGVVGAERLVVQNHVAQEGREQARVAVRVGERSDESKEELPTATRAELARPVLGQPGDEGS